LATLAICFEGGLNSRLANNTSTTSAVLRRIALDGEQQRGIGLIFCSASRGNQCLVVRNSHPNAVIHLRMQ